MVRPKSERSTTAEPVITIRSEDTTSTSTSNTTGRVTPLRVKPPATVRGIRAPTSTRAGRPSIEAGSKTANSFSSRAEPRMGPRMARSRKPESVSSVRTLTTISPIREAGGSAKSTSTSPATSEVTPTTRVGSPFSSSSISKRTDERSPSIRNTAAPPPPSAVPASSSAASAAGAAAAAAGAAETGGAVTGALGSPLPPANHT